MSTERIMMYEEEHAQLIELCERLNGEAKACAVLLVERSGQFIAGHGDVDRLDTTSLASLAAGSVAATHGLAELIGERAFPSSFHEGEREHLHLSMIADRAILVVLFDERTSLGLVRLRLRKFLKELSELFERMEFGTEDQKSGVALGEISDRDIDRLFV